MHNNACFGTQFYSAGPHHGIQPPKIVFDSVSNMTYFIARAHGTAERGFGKHEGEWTRKVEIRTMKKWTRKLEIWDNKEMDQEARNQDNDEMDQEGRNQDNEEMDWEGRNQDNEEMDQEARNQDNEEIHGLG